MRVLKKNTLLYNIDKIRYSFNEVNDMKLFDVLIIGGGPAGLNAALYAARKELSVALVSPDIGGQMLLTNEIENYLGIPSISGFELADAMEAQVRKYPVELISAGAKTLSCLKEGYFTAHLDDGQEVSGKTCIVTAGKRSRLLGIPGEKEYAARGVSYCATCDGPFYRGKSVAVIGGGDSAVQAAIELSALCPEVFLVVRSRIRAEEILVRRMEQIPSITVLKKYKPLKVEGEKKVTALRIKHTDTAEEKVLNVEGVFVEIGGIPNNGFLPPEVAVNELGELITDKEGKTNIPGLFGAGDVTDAKRKQIILAAGEGAAAALAAHDYLLRSES